MSEPQPFEQLLERYLQSSATPEEYDQLMQYVKQGEHDEQLKAIILAAMQHDEVTVRLDTIRANDLLNRILMAEEQTAKLIPMSEKKPIWKRVAVAASILFVVGLGSYFIFFHKPAQQIEIAQTQEQRFKNDVAAPTENRAMIVLADGTKVYLDSAANGSLATQSNVVVKKTADGQIVYESTVDGQQSIVQYNTLSNPRGSKVIDMTLSDGSRVWLNAGSSVTYPVAFVGNERKVNITGEAYFEVAHNASKPFFVSKGDVSVQVLGTHFNVNAYDDESDVKVTLLEGSVKIASTSSRNDVLLKPGEQAQVSNSIKIVKGVDVEQVMAWKNGKFDFGESSDLKDIMRQIGRWYDVEIEYRGEMNQKFWGSISRQENVSKVLEKFELTGRVHFKIEGRKIIVSQ